MVQTGATLLSGSGTTGKGSNEPGSGATIDPCLRIDLKIVQGAMEPATNSSRTGSYP